MSQQIELVAEARADVGKGASRRLRRNAAMVPGIVYGGGEAPVNISLIENDLSKAIQADTFFSQILALKIGGARSQVLARDMQRHPATEQADAHRLPAHPREPGNHRSDSAALHQRRRVHRRQGREGSDQPPHHRSGSDLSAEGSAGSHRRRRGSAEDRRHPAPVGSEAAGRRRARGSRRSDRRRTRRAERRGRQRACVDARSRNGCDGYAPPAKPPRPPQRVHRTEPKPEGEEAPDSDKG